MRAKGQSQAGHSEMMDTESIIQTRKENGLGMCTKRLTSKHINIRGPEYRNINGGHMETTSNKHVHEWTTRTSILTSTYGPIVTPAYIAVSHFETIDAL